MKIDNYLFPHPIFGFAKDYDRVPEVSFDYSYSSDNEMFSFSFDVKGIVPELLSLLEAKKVRLICEINCSNTIYRKVFYSFTSALTFQISDKDLKEKVSFQLMLLADEDINDFSSTSLTKDRKTHRIDFERGDVVGILLTHNINVDLAGSSVSDFIKITENTTDDQVRYEFTKKHVEIKIPKSKLQELQLLKNNPDFDNILISTLIIPALIHALYLVNEASESEHGSKGWFQVLKEKSKEHLDKSYPEDSSEISKLLDAILSDPLDRLFADLKKLTKK
jgi:hypothetical protein